MSAIAEPLQRSRGELRLEFKRRGPISTLASLYQEGCLKARIPRRVGMATEAICINTAGGLTDGDTARTRVVCRPGASAIVASQAAERIYRSRGAPAKIHASLDIEAGATLGWLPQETILFDGGRVSRRVDIRMPSSARLLAVEATILGRTAMGETMMSGSVSERWHIEIDGRLAFADALRLDGPGLDAQARRPAVLGACCAFASIVFVSKDAAGLLAELRDPESSEDCTFGATLHDGLVVMRCAARTGEALRNAVIAALASVCKRYDEFYLPKVWNL